MNIAGYRPNSFVDFPGNISAVVFLGNCNFNCWYCHNKHMLNKKPLYSTEQILDKIAINKDFLDAVVVSGGEPTTEKAEDLVKFILNIKKLGLKVKFDTNGTDYKKLELLLPYLDYVAMDIKAPFEKYKEITDITPDQIKSIKNSIKLLLNCGIDYEFRTTLLPTLSDEDLSEIADYIKDCRYYYVQQYIPVTGYSQKPYSPLYITESIERIRQYIPCKTRGI